MPSTSSRIDLLQNELFSLYSLLSLHSAFLCFGAYNIHTGYLLCMKLCVCGTVLKNSLENKSDATCKFYITIFHVRSGVIKTCI